MKGDTDEEGRRRIGVLNAEVELGRFVVEDAINGLEVEGDGFISKGEKETASGEGVDDKEGENNSGNEIVTSDPGGEGGETDDSSTEATINVGSVERSSINLTKGIFVGDEEETSFSKGENDDKVDVDSSVDLKGLYFG